MLGGVLEPYGLVMATAVTASVDLDGSGGIDPATESGIYVFENVPAGRYEVRQVAPTNWAQTAAGIDPAVAELPAVRFTKNWTFYHAWDPFNFDPVWEDHGFQYYYDLNHMPSIWKMNLELYQDVWEPNAEDGWGMLEHNMEFMLQYAPGADPYSYWFVFEDAGADWLNLGHGGMDYVDFDVRITEGYEVSELLIHTVDYGNSVALHEVLKPDGDAIALPGEGWEDFVFAMRRDFVLSRSQTVGLMDFGVAEAMTVSGQVFEDLNGNGVRDAGEAGLDGWSVDVDAAVSGDGLATATTVSVDLDGSGAIDPETESGLWQSVVTVPVDLAVSARTRTGWGVTAPAAGYDVPFAPGEAGGLNFGVAEYVTVSGQVFEDANGNGVHDAGEVGLNDWTVNIMDAATGTVVRVTTTEDQDLDGLPGIDPETESGRYTVGGFLPGEYLVREVLPADYVQTLPGNSSVYTVAPASGDSVTDLDFGNAPAGTAIRGQLFDDLDGDGRQDAGEGGINGRTIELVDPATDTVIDSTTTAWEDINRNGLIDDGENGFYQFFGLGGGDYEVRQVLPEGWEATAPVAYPTEHLNYLHAIVIDGGSAQIQWFNRLDGSFVGGFDLPAVPTGTAYQGLAVGPTSVFYVDSSSLLAGTVWELEPLTGVVIDSDALSFSPIYAIKGLAYLDGELFIHYLTDQIAVWDPATDSLSRTLTLGTPNLDALTAAGDLGVLFATTLAGDIVAVDPADGSILSTFSPGLGPLDAGLAYMAGELLTGSAGVGGLVTRINADDGTVLGPLALTPMTGQITGLGGDEPVAPSVVDHVLTLAGGERAFGIDFGAMLAGGGALGGGLGDPIDLLGELEPIL